jgi:Leucine-rich repeat (LRR) protein
MPPSLLTSRDLQTRFSLLHSEASIKHFFPLVRSQSTGTEVGWIAGSLVDMPSFHGHLCVCSPREPPPDILLIATSFLSCSSGPPPLPEGLTVLNLSNNEIDTIQNLDPLSALTRLNLSNNKIKVTPLSLSLPSPPSSSLCPCHLPLFLHFSSPRKPKPRTASLEQVLENLGGLRQLIELRASGNGITSISPSASIHSLTCLDLADNKIDSLSCLDTLSSISGLSHLVLAGEAAHHM